VSGTASRFGPLLSDNGVTFRLWAPAARAVNLVLDRKKIAMPVTSKFPIRRPTSSQMM
jgi:1,4-alpha-glucan branching enzyme